MFNEASHDLTESGAFSFVGRRVPGTRGGRSASRGQQMSLKVSVGVIAFYEKAIKVKADVAAFLS